MNTGEQIKSLRKYASRLPKTQSQDASRIHWACNELERMKSGKLDTEELLALFQNLVLQISENSLNISLLEDRLDRSDDDSEW